MALLLVDDSQDVLLSCTRYLSSAVIVRTAASYADGCTLYAQYEDWDAAIFDVRLSEIEPDGGLRLLHFVRARNPALPIAMLTANDTREVINEAAQMGALFFVKPPELAALLDFVRRSVAIRAIAPASEPIFAAQKTPMEELSEEATLLFQLSPRETEVLSWALARQSREAFLRQYGITRSTWDKHVGRLLRKTGSTSLEQLVSDLLGKMVRRRLIQS
jgi:DNA-binding NarL/FixJ family response regulator